MCCDKVATTQYFLKKYCVVAGKIRWQIHATITHNSSLNITHSARNLGFIFDEPYRQLNHSCSQHIADYTQQATVCLPDTVSLLGCSALAHLAHPVERVPYIFMPTADSSFIRS